MIELQPESADIRIALSILHGGFCHFRSQLAGISQGDFSIFLGCLGGASCNQVSLLYLHSEHVLGSNHKGVAVRIDRNSLVDSRDGGQIIKRDDESFGLIPYILRALLELWPVGIDRDISSNRASQKARSWVCSLQPEFRLPECL